MENAIKAYFDPNEWDWSTNTVRQNELISLIDGISGVDYVSSLTLDGQTLIGTDNIGYYTSSGGTKTTVNLDISGVAPDDASVPRGSGASDYAAGGAASTMLTLTLPIRCCMSSRTLER